MIHPIPPGTRDILPDEMRELRACSRPLTDVFERYGYGEVATPTLEYDEVLRAATSGGGIGAYRFFDERGELLALRSDMTIPIARLAPEPLRRRRAALALLLHRQRLPRGQPPAGARCASSCTPGSSCSARGARRAPPR